MSVDGLTPDLIFAAATIFVACTLVLWGRLGFRWAFALALIKVSIATIYFGYFQSDSWRLLDDITYAEEAAELVAAGSGPVSLLTSESDTLFSVVGSRHVGY